MQGDPKRAWRLKRQLTGTLPTSTVQLARRAIQLAEGPSDSSQSRDGGRGGYDVGGPTKATAEGTDARRGVGEMKDVTASGGRGGHTRVPGSAGFSVTHSPDRACARQRTINYAKAKAAVHLAKEFRYNQS